ncbi:hypothetical protein SLA2020_291280 [Shorea laevis]
MGMRGSKLSRLIGARGNEKGSVGGSLRQLTPKGYVPVCVGVDGETRRFIVHWTMLARDADFLDLLCKSAEEYGFCNDGVLKIPHEAKDFEERIVRRAKQKILRV